MSKSLYSLPLIPCIALLLCHCGSSSPASTAPTGSTGSTTPQNFSCPAGEEDVMQYFAMAAQYRATEYMSGEPNSIYTQVFPNEDFAASGYWFWLKSASAHGFDVKAFDQNYVYIRSTELVWTDNTTFKRFVTDLPIAARCVGTSEAGPELQEANTNFQYFSSCSPYKSSQLGTSVNDIDAPALMDTGGNLGQLWTRVLHYRYNCDENFQDCVNEEQFFLAKDYGQWQWIHYQNGAVVNSALINNIETGTASGTLPCSNSYQ